MKRDLTQILEKLWEMVAETIFFSLKVENSEISYHV